MFQLIYCSEAHADNTVQDISDIMSSSQAFNIKHDITGCLLLQQNQFMQFMEGDQETVKQLYSKICLDRRHHNVTLVSTATHEQRLFNKWNIAFLDKEETPTGQGFSSIAKKPADTVRMFKRIARKMALSNTFQ